MAEQRILLSGPDIGPDDRAALLRAFDDGWIAPVGPELAAFEEELSKYTGAEACVALASGTAALHLALLIAGVGPGDEVIVQSATFAASAFAVVHAGATPVFIDSDQATWCLDPELLAAVLEDRANRGNLPAAVMPVDLYGSVADYPAITSVCNRYGIPVIEDAAEALGSRTTEGMAGALGHTAVLSFNGNKIMTTGGGGALLGSEAVVQRALYLATQARESVLEYKHHEIGFNYRLSNLLAGLGRSQLAGLEERIERRHRIADTYRSQFPEIEWCPYRSTSRPNRWLSVGLLPEGMEPALVCKELDVKDIEARPFWMPMHHQPVFARNTMYGGNVSDELFGRGICLPSGSSMSQGHVDRVVTALRDVLDRHVGGQLSG